MSEPTFYTGTPATEATPPTQPPPPGTPAFVAGLLQATCSIRKVQAIIAPAWDGPQIMAFTASLPMGERPEAIEALDGALAMAAGADNCRIARTGGRLLIELPKPPAERKPLKALRLEHIAPPTSTAVCAGIATGGAPVWIDIADERTAHLLIGGTTGSGKSVLLKWLIYRLVMQNATDTLRLILLDPKRFELREFAQVPHLAHPITSAPLDVARVLSWVGSELERRAETGRNRPRLVVAIEEVADLSASNRDMIGLIARIAQIGRALGIHLVASTQQPGAKSLGDSLVNFPARCLGRVASSTLAYGAAGRKQTGADALLGRGDFLLVAAGETTRFQAPLPDGRQWSQLPRGGPGSLSPHLPTLAEFADRDRDPRGGHTHRELAGEDYSAIEHAIAGGATVRQVMEKFGIGYERAQRIFTTTISEVQR